MAAILTELMVPTFGDAVQRCLTDWVAYMPDATLAWAMNGGNGATLRYLETVVTGPVNTVTNRYHCADLWQASVHSVSYMMSLPGLIDLSPPVMQPTYGARDTFTLFKSQFFTPVEGQIQALCLAGIQSVSSFSGQSPGTGFTVKYVFWSAYYQQQYGLGIAKLLLRDPATALIQATGTFRAKEGQVAIPPGPPAGPTEATMARIAAALEAISLSRLDVSINHGQAIASVKGGATTG
jgi:hypothetical protein